MKPTIFMPEELKNKWVKALRSGEYKKGVGMLKTPTDKYCCLGVLQCVVSGTVEISIFGNPFAVPSNQWLEKHKIIFINTEGNTAKAPALTPTQTADTINDAQRHSFKRIADMIEKAYGGEITELK